MVGGTGSYAAAVASALDLEALRDFWHPVAWAHELGEHPVRTELLGTAVVIWRAAEGDIRAFRDLCLHRGTALSLGTVEDGCLVCPYHGWTYAADGRCTHIPQLEPGRPIPERVRSTAAEQPSRLAGCRDARPSRHRDNFWTALADQRRAARAILGARSELGQRRSEAENVGTIVERARANAA